MTLQNSSAVQPLVAIGADVGVLAEEFQRISDNAAEVYRGVLRLKNEGKVLCKCHDCASEQPDAPLWERPNYICRGYAATHMRIQRESFRLPPPQKVI